MENEDKAEHIVNKIIPKFFDFVVKCNIFNEDGSITIEYTERAQGLYDDILKYLDSGK